MATSYIGTSGLGQVLGSSLGTGGLSRGQQFQDFSTGVQRRKRHLSGASAAERTATAKRRTERLTRSTQETSATSPVDTADVKVPDVKVAPGDSPATVAAITTSNELATGAGITQAPAAAPAPAPATPVVHPGQDLSQADLAFAQAYSNYEKAISGRIGTGRVKSASSALTSQYKDLVGLAQATGNKRYIEAATNQDLARSVGFAQSSISAQNIARASGALSSGMTALSDVIDWQWAAQQNLAPAPAAPAGAGVSVRRGRRGGNLIQTAIRTGMRR